MSIDDSLTIPPSANAESARKQEEIDFHNQREVDRQHMSHDEFEKRYSNKKWYAVVEKSRRFTDRWLENHCPNARALDYCCGLGGMSLQLAKAGAFINAIDISDESVKTTQALLSENGYADQCEAQVMDGENLEFEDNSFDVIICSGVLHHLDLNNAYPELSRVLKPSGKILCMEALGHNPLINLYRRRTPALRTAWEVDHIIKNKDLKFAEQFFGKVKADYFHFFGIGAVLFRKTPLFNPVLKTLDAIDSVVLSVPSLRQMAWQIVFELSQPKRGAKTEQSSSKAA
ncbi:MAG: class I SAM-dependent methyltransferase [Candidatus Paceibacterota bacterium]